VHGQQRIGVGGRPEPLEYYNRAGPVGQALAGLPPSNARRLGVIGLGAGAMSCYRPGSTTFFEIDPEVERIARDPKLFTYLRDCPARVVLGDGRLSLTREPLGALDVLVVDAFNSDAIPVHLITLEALKVYLDRVGPRGTILFHISNRYLRLEPVLASLARDLGLVCRAQRHTPTKAQEARGYVISKWAILARRPNDLGRVAADSRWHACTDNGTPVWTDDYSDLVGSMSFG
jgi:spermidine synthase